AIVTEASEVTGPFTASRPLPITDRGIEPVLTSVKASAPELVRSTSWVIPAVGPVTPLVPPPVHPAATAAGVRSMIPAVSPTVRAGAVWDRVTLLSRPVADDTVTTPAADTSRRVLVAMEVTVATTSLPSPPA